MNSGIEKSVKAAKRVGMIALLGLATAALTGARAEAQGIERIMSARETLALTEDQISRLDAIRREMVAERSAEQAEIAELRSQLAAGQIRQSQLMAAQEARVDAAQGRQEERQARIDAVLTEEQRGAVELMRNTRAAGGRGPRAQGVAPGRGRGQMGPAGRGGARPGGFGPRGRRGGAFQL